jgi:hypothetical protein
MNRRGVGTPLRNLPEEWVARPEAALGVDHQTLEVVHGLETRNGYQGIL